MKTFWAFALTAVISWLWYADYYWHINPHLEVTFLDIGQGDSIWIKTPHGRTVLIDGGPGTTVLERLGEETSWWQSTIDMMVLSHPDLDHLEGLLEVLKRYQVEHVLLTGAAHGSALYQEFLKELQKQQVLISVADPSQDWQIDEDTYLDVLAPIEPVTFLEPENANDASVVFKLIYKNSTLLLTGDIEVDGEAQLLATATDISAQLLKSGHHGSVTSSSPHFLQAVQAEAVVIQAGRDNPFGHPHTETLLRYDERSMPWISTHQEGTIRMISDGENWKIL